MRTPLALTAALVLSLPALKAGAATSLPLAQVAIQAGYHYEWSPGSVVLSRPGIVVVLRPGEAVYQVNSHDEVADSSPCFTHGDLYVTPALAAHLEALARRYSPHTAARSAARSKTDPSAQGSISLEARQLQGAEAITVDGTAPANVPVTITLLAIVSSDVPTIVVNKRDLVTGVTGRFGAVIPIASAYERGTIFRVVATSIPNITSASEELIMEAPNHGVTVPLERMPHGAR